MISPGWMPARCAGPPLATCTTWTAISFSIWNLLRSDCGSMPDWTTTPMTGRRTTPSFIKRDATQLTVLIGMANESPCLLDDGHVDADDRARGIHQWATGVAGVDGSVGLDDIFDQLSAVAWQGTM